MSDMTVSIEITADATKAEKALGDFGKKAAESFSRGFDAKRLGENAAKDVGDGLDRNTSKGASDAAKKAEKVFIGGFDGKKIGSKTAKDFTDTLDASKGAGEAAKKAEKVFIGGFDGRSLGQKSSKDFTDSLEVAGGSQKAAKDAAAKFDSSFDGDRIGDKAGREIGGGLKGGSSKGAGDAARSAANTFEDKADGKRVGEKVGDDIGDGIEKESSKGSAEAGSKSGKIFSDRFKDFLKANLAAKALVGIGKGVGKAISEGIGGGLKRLMGVEEAQAKMRGLGFTAADAANVVKQAQESVQGTVYTTADAAQVASSALSAGLKPGEQLDKYLGAIKNTAAASGSQMSEMGSIFNKVLTGGVAQAQELNQMADRGIPIFTALGEEMGVPQSAVKKLASESKISFEQFQNAAIKATGTVSEEMGNTLSGSLQNLKGSFAIVGQNLFDGIYPALTPLAKGLREAMRPVGDIAGELGTKIGQSLVPAMESFSDWLIDMPDHIEKTKTVMTDLSDRFETMGTWIKESQVWLQPLVVGLGAAAGVFALNAAAIAVSNFSLEGYKKKVMETSVAQLILNNVIKANPFVKVLALVMALVGGFTYFFTKTELGQKIVKAALEKIGQAFEWLRGVWDNVQPYLVAGWDAIKDAVGSVVDWFTSTAGPVLSGIWEGLKSAAEPVVEWIQENVVPVLASMWDQMLETGGELAAWYGEHVAPVFDALKELALAVYEEGVKPFVEGFKSGWEAVGDALSSVWTSYISPVLTWIGDGLEFLWKNIIGPAALAIAGLWLTIGSTLWDVWTKYLSVVFTAIASGWSILWTGIKTVWTVFSTAFTTSFRVAWEAVKLIFSTVWEAIKTIVTTVLGQIKATIEFVLGVIKNVIKAITSAIRGDWEGFWKALRNIGDLALGFIRGSIERIFNGIMGFLSRTWDNIKSTADKSWNLISGGITKVVEGIRSGVEETFSKMKDAVGRIWDGLKSLVASPINVVIGFVNDGIIGTYNKVAKALKLPELNVSIPKVKFQQGGYVDLPWSATNRDPYIGAIGGTPAFRFEGEEFIVSRQRTKQFRPVLEAINSGRVTPEQFRNLPKHASGGAVKPVNASSSGWNGGRYRSGKWHGGLDFPAGTGTPIYAMWDGVVSSLKRLNRSYGHHVRIDHGGGVQTLYAHMSRILTKVGAKVSAGSRIGAVGSTGNSTGPHLHLEVRQNGKQVNPTPYLNGAQKPKGKGIVGEAFGWVSEQFSKAKELGFSSVKDWFESIGDKVGKFFGPVNDLAGGFGDLVKGMGSKLRDGLKEWVSDKLNPFGEHEGTTAADGTDLSNYSAPKGVARWENTALRALRIVGQPSSLLNSTLRRMNQESGGNPKAINLWDSNARMGIPSKGLMQVIDPTFRAYRDKSLPNNIWDPLANIVASMRYALKRYGSLSKAYNKRGGYWTGTLSALPGWSLVGEQGPEFIKLRGGEVIKNAGESRRMMNAYGDKGGGLVVHGDLVLQVSMDELERFRDLEEALVSLPRLSRKGAYRKGVLA